MFQNRWEKNIWCDTKRDNSLNEKSYKYDLEFIRKYDGESW